MKEYKISVKLTTIDMYRFLMRHEYNSFSGLFGLAASLVALLALILGVGEGDRNTQIVLVVLAAAFTILNPIRLFFRAQKQITLNPTFHKPIEYTFGEAGLHIAQGEEQMDVAWGDMKKLVKGKKIMTLYLSKVVGYIFPESQCDGQYDEIGEMIQEQIEKAGKLAGANSPAEAEGQKQAEISAKASQPAETDVSEKEQPASTQTEKTGKEKEYAGVFGLEKRSEWKLPSGEEEIWGDDEEDAP